MQKFRITAIVLNCIGLFLFVFYFNLGGPWWRLNFLGVIIIFLTGILPLVNLIYIVLVGESWLSLYFQRIAAENQKRLAELKANRDS